MELKDSERKARSTEPKQIIALTLMAGGKVRVGLQGVSDTEETVELDIHPTKADVLRIGMWVDVALVEVEKPGL